MIFTDRRSFRRIGGGDPIYGFGLYCEQVAWNIGYRLKPWLFRRNTLRCWLADAALDWVDRQLARFERWAGKKAL